ncbi:MAG: DUF3795 domain-containing protein [Coprothermobacterota bacterium]|nr:DUF3795 domain-containing protein [Coprothermobacterota bacterium]
MERMLGMCGLNCLECDAYQATKANDDVLRDQVAKKWREEYQVPGMTAADIHCNSCLSPTGPWIAHCLECEVRLCGLQKAVDHCGVCQEYADCRTIQSFLEMAPAARTNLEEARGG